MDEDFLQNLRDGNWGYESETSSFSHSDVRHPWEDEVNAQGELFYVMHYPLSKDATDRTQENVLINESQNDKTSSGILGRLMRRRSSRRSFRRKDDKGVPKRDEEFLMSPEETISSIRKVDPNDCEPINVYMKIDFPNMKIIGRRSTAIETFLGLKVSFHGPQVIINDIISNSPASVLAAFQKGDWLHSINGIVMTPENIENYLRNISFSKEVKEVVVTINRRKPSVNLEPSTSSALTEQEDYEMEGFSMLYLKIGRNTDMISSEDVVFSYPCEGNIISPIRGAFLTLFHLLPSLSANQPISTTLNINNQVINVIYTKKDDGLLLMAMPESRISLKELYWVNTDVIRCLQFTFQSLSRCFSSERNFNSLKKFFHALFKRVIHRCLDFNYHYEFESILPAVSCLPLSHDIYAQVDDALNELEANDIEGFEDQKLYSIVGSCFFYKGYNICSHLGREDLIDINSLCRQSDISAFMKGGVSDLVFWKEIFPASMNRGLNSHVHVPYSLLPATWYLLIVAKDHNFLFVILESGGYTIRLLQNSGPEVAYVEEALATLKHIMKIGIGNIVNKLIKDNDEPAPKPALNYSSSSTEHSLLSSTLSETTLSKQHSLSYRSLDNCQLARSRSNINVITASGYDSVSSDDCAPVIGRRAERELAMETLSRASDISDDSDWNKDFKSFNRGPNTEAHDAELNCPPKITVGPREVMLHYVHMDKASGVLISSVNNSKECALLLNNFRFHAHEIQKILMNTISFKKLKTQEVSSSIINKSMIAIKEHGILFECGDGKNNIKSYWVVGKIFFTPQLREVYLCYQDTCPQNMIDVAFRIALSCNP